MCEQESGKNAITMVSNLMNVKDSRWLQLEVCREFQRGQCSRNDQECKFAHPPSHVEIQNGKVTACYDSIKGRCQRENPKCKYLHPPQHLKDQLLVNGRNTLALKNMLMTQLGGSNTVSPPATAATATLVNPLQMGPTSAFSFPGVQAYSPYYTLNASSLYPGLVAASSPEAAAVALQQSAAGAASAMNGMENYFFQAGILPAISAAGSSPALQTQLSQKQPQFSRSDRIEPSAANAAAAQAAALSAMLSSATSAAQSSSSSIGKKRQLDEVAFVGPFGNAESFMLAAALQPSLKRLAVAGPGDVKSGLPIYQPVHANLPGALQYQQLAYPMPLPAGLMEAGATNNALGSTLYKQQQHSAAFIKGPESALFLSRMSTNNSPANKITIGDVHSNFEATVEGQRDVTFDSLTAATVVSAASAHSSTSSARFANNTSCVAYLDESGQLLDTLPVCRDFKQGHCERNGCRYVHLIEDYVEVNSEGKVTVCRDFSKGKCSRQMCKYYHLPIQSSGCFAMPGPASTTSNDVVNGLFLQQWLQAPSFQLNSHANVLSSVNSSGPLPSTSFQPQQQQLIGSQLAAFLPPQSSLLLNNSNIFANASTSLPTNGLRLFNYASPQQQASFVQRGDESSLNCTLGRIPEQGLHCMSTCKKSIWTINQLQT